jgi:hypothetical protein
VYALCVEKKVYLVQNALAPNVGQKAQKQKQKKEKKTEKKQEYTKDNKRKICLTADGQKVNVMFAEKT